MNNRVSGIQWEGRTIIEILIYVATAVALFVAALLVYAATKPDTFRVQRTTGIDAPAERIFPLIANLKAMNTWNPFVDPDPAIKIAYSAAGLTFSEF